MSMPVPRLRHSVAWSLGGNALFAASQWVLLTSVAKLGGAEMVGQFALALAITSPVFLFTGLQLGTVQATDAFNRFQFADYLALRLVSTGLALLVVLVTVIVWPQDRTTLAVTLIIGISKALDSVSDVIYGFFRKHERIDLITLSMSFRGIGSVIIFTGIMAATSKLAWAAGGLALAGCITLAAYDVPRLRGLAEFAGGQESGLAPRWSAHSARQLVTLTFALGLSSMLTSLNTNIPRYFIEHWLGEKSLGFFAGVTYITMAGTFVVSAVAQAILPRMATYYKSKDVHAVKTLAFRLSAIALCVGLGSVAVSAFAGRQILSIMYRHDYGAYATLLVLASCAGTVAYVASIMNCAMNAAHRYRQQLPLTAATCFATTLASCLLIPAYSLAGAALALTAGYALQAAGGAVVVSRALRSLKRKTVHSHA